MNTLHHATAPGVASLRRRIPQRWLRLMRGAPRSQFVHEAVQAHDTGEWHPAVDCTRRSAALDRDTAITLHPGDGGPLVLPRPSTLAWVLEALLAPVHTQGHDPWGCARVRHVLLVAEHPAHLDTWAQTLLTAALGPHGRVTTHTPATPAGADGLRAQAVLVCGAIDVPAGVLSALPAGARIVTARGEHWWQLVVDGRGAATGVTLPDLPVAADPLRPRPLNALDACWPHAAAVPAPALSVLRHATARDALRALLPHARLTWQDTPAPPGEPPNGHLRVELPHHTDHPPGRLQLWLRPDTCRVLADAPEIRDTVTTAMAGCIGSHAPDPQHQLRLQLRPEGARLLPRVLREHPDPQPGALDRLVRDWTDSGQLTLDCIRQTLPLLPPAPPAAAPSHLAPLDDRHHSSRVAVAVDVDTLLWQAMRMLTADPAIPAGHLGLPAEAVRTLLTRERAIPAKVTLPRRHHDPPRGHSGPTGSPDPDRSEHPSRSSP